jgi:hypothetical protein
MSFAAIIELTLCPTWRQSAAHLPTRSSIITVGDIALHTAGNDRRSLAMIADQHRLILPDMVMRR